MRRQSRDGGGEQRQWMRLSLRAPFSEVVVSFLGGAIDAATAL